MRQKQPNICVCPGACDCVDRLVQGPSHEGNKKQKADEGRESVQEREKERQAGRRTIKDLIKREKQQKLYGREGSIMYM